MSCRGGVARILNSFLDNLGLLGVCRGGLGRVDGYAGGVGGGSGSRGVGGRVLGSVDGWTGNRSGGSGSGRVGRVGRVVLEAVDSSSRDDRGVVGVRGGGTGRVDGRTSYFEGGLLVSGLGTSTVFTLDLIDGAVGGNVLAVNFDRCLSKGSVSVGRSEEKRWSMLVLGLVIRLEVAVSTKPTTRPSLQCGRGLQEQKQPSGPS